jgi:hypothetical protein
MTRRSASKQHDFSRYYMQYRIFPGKKVPLKHWFPKWSVPAPPPTAGRWDYLGGRQEGRGGRGCWRWAPPSTLFTYLRIKWLSTRHWETGITSWSPSIALRIYWHWSSYYSWMRYLILLLGEHTRPVSRQRLGKHVAVARQQILNNATVGLQQWKSCVFYVVRAEML